MTVLLWLLCALLALLALWVVIVIGSAMLELLPTVIGLLVCWWLLHAIGCL